MIKLHLWQFMLCNFGTVAIGTFLGAMVAGGFLIRKLDIARLQELIDDNEEKIEFLEQERVCEQFRRWCVMYTKIQMMYRQQVLHLRQLNQNQLNKE